MITCKLNIRRSQCLWALEHLPLLLIPCVRAQSCPTLAFQASMSVEFSGQEYWSGLQFSSFRRPSWPRDQTCISCVGRRILYHYATWKALFLSLCCSVTELCLSLCKPMDCSTQGFPVLHHLPELAQTYVHWVSGHNPPIIQSHPLSSPSLLAFNLSKHQGLY